MQRRFDISRITGPYRMVYWDGGTLRLDNGGHATMGKPDKAGKGKESAPGQVGGNQGQDKLRTFYGPDGSAVQASMTEYKNTLRDQGYLEEDDLAQQGGGEEPVDPAG